MTDGTQAVVDAGALVLGQWSTRYVMWATGASRRQMQWLVEGGVLVPARKGHKAGPGVPQRPDLFSLQQIVAVAYGQAFLAAGAAPVMANLAVAWVARQRWPELLLEFKFGRRVLALTASGNGVLVPPVVGPEAGRDDLVRDSCLDLAECYGRVWLRMFKGAAGSPAAAR